MSHYDTLGVTKTADEKELKSAFRKLAMAYHPDKNPGDASAEAKFKEINEAYETLKDPDKRAHYDHTISGGFHAGPRGGQSRQKADWSDIFAKSRQYGNFNSEMDIEEILRRAQRHQQQYNQQSARNKDTLLNYTVSLDDVFTGKEVELRYTTGRGTKTTKVNIPRSVNDGARIRYAGMGDDSNPNVPPGDLYVVVSVAQHNLFVRNGDNLSTSVTIDFIEAMIGAYKRVPLIDGSEINLRINAGLTPGSHIKVPEKGLWNPHGVRGSLLVEVVMVQPKLNNAQYELLAKIKNL